MTIPAVIQELDEAQWQQQLAHHSVFLLADPTFNEAVRYIAESQLPENPDINRLYWGELGRLHASLSPCLIRAHQSNWPHLQQEICSRPNWGIAWVLEGDILAYTLLQQLQLLIHHLRRWSWIADGEEAQLLRLSDWKVVQTLLQASSAQEVADFVGPATALVTIDGDKITRLQPHLTSSQWKRPQPNEPKVLTEYQLLALQHMAQAITYRDYLAHLQQHHPETEQWSEEERLRFISTHTAQAPQYGFKDKQQQVKLLTLAYLFGDDFYHLPWVKPILMASRQGPDDRMHTLFRAAEAQLDKDETR